MFFYSIDGKENGLSVIRLHSSRGPFQSCWNSSSVCVNEYMWVYDSLQSSTTPKHLSLIKAPHFVPLKSWTPKRETKGLGIGREKGKQIKTVQNVVNLKTWTVPLGKRKRQTQRKNVSKYTWKRQNLKRFSCHRIGYMGYFQEERKKSEHRKIILISESMSQARGMPYNIWLTIHKCWSLKHHCLFWIDSESLNHDSLMTPPAARASLITFCNCARPRSFLSSKEWQRLLD